MNAWLRERDKKLIFMIDGLDDLQNYEQGQVCNSLVAVQTLCQNVIKELGYMNHRHIGLLIFVRRDIVRFLKYASQDAKSVPLQFKDRYIMPKKIREAIEPCAKDKLKEIEQEMPKIYEILQKITDESLPEKILPLELEKISVTVDEVDRLERQGSIKLSEKKYYLPEIIRQALGFRYKVGARPKVLSLLIK